MHVYIHIQCVHICIYIYIYMAMANNLFAMIFWWVPVAVIAAGSFSQRRAPRPPKLPALKAQVAGTAFALSVAQ